MGVKKVGVKKCGQKKVGVKKMGVKKKGIKKNEGTKKKQLFLIQKIGILFNQKNRNPF